MTESDDSTRPWFPGQPPIMSLAEDRADSERLNTLYGVFTSRVAPLVIRSAGTSRSCPILHYSDHQRSALRQLSTLLIVADRPWSEEGYGSDGVSLVCFGPPMSQQIDRFTDGGQGSVRRPQVTMRSGALWLVDEDQSLEAYSRVPGADPALEMLADISRGPDVMTWIQRAFAGDADSVSRSPLPGCILPGPRTTDGRDAV